MKVQVRSLQETLETCGSNDGRGFEFGKQRVKALWFEIRTQRHGDSACLEDAIVGHDVFNAVFQHDRDAVAKADAPIYQKCGQAVGVGVDLTVGGTGLLVNDGNLVGEAAGGIFEKLVD
nr:hypothetical protein [Desulfosarcina cetonica]